MRTSCSRVQKDEGEKQSGLGKMLQRILVVDDNEELQELVSSALEREGYDVLTADDAVQGLEVIERAKIDLALFDVMMPGMGRLVRSSSVAFQAKSSAQFQLYSTSQRHIYKDACRDRQNV